MKANLLELFYIICGLIAIYIGLKNAFHREKKNYASVIFWLALGIVLSLGKWLPSMVSGILVVIMAVPAMLNKVKPSSGKYASEEYKMQMAKKFGLKLFIPAMTIGVVALIFAKFIPSLGALVGLGVGAILAAVIILVMAKDSPKELGTEGGRLLEAVGPISMLPQLLTALGAIFTAAGVGEVISNGVGSFIPAGNLTVGIIAYSLGMVIFTMIMGNAFAAFSVITVGIGIPFVISTGVNPSVVGILALTSGYCGTLMTPMAANFNIVPVALLDMKDKYGVIKRQIPIAFMMIVFQIILIHIMA
ncbi:DUF979 domain-containing protein [Acidaminobacter sp. JC074]|uniref:DUF979 domain-containing protein n=1 Tax=Acidaminobacter sp. JC074 TaxID=2530199 RepID=UPI001F104210|nr:DUF979 domain-containing protein [Acidaminobacter sp. JC074]MCH4886955.1 DUF979 domain-containing protein [Acidaminobacter sp. JC074]